MLDSCVKFHDLYSLRHRCGPYDLFVPLHQRPVDGETTIAKQVGVRGVSEADEDVSVAARFASSPAGLPLAPLIRRNRDWRGGGVQNQIISEGKIISSE